VPYVKNIPQFKSLLIKKTYIVALSIMAFRHIQRWWLCEKICQT